MSYFLLQAVKKVDTAARVWTTRAAACLSKYKKILLPTSKTEDDRRREYILNIILILSLCALSILGATLYWNSAHVEKYTGMSPFYFTIIILIYASLFYASKKGYWKIATILLLIINMAGTMYTGWKWGASLPETLLLTVLVIAIASVLISSTAGFVTSGVMIASLAIMGIHEAIHLNVPDWRLDEISITDVITYSVMFLFISFIVWLSNRQIDASLKRARESEKLLQAERNILEQRVSERTEELIIDQRKRLMEVDRIVKVGELAQGIIHDLMSPLTSMNLYMEEIHSRPEKYSSDMTHAMFVKTLEASRRMKSFMESARHLISPGQLHENMSVNLHKKVIMAYDVVAYNARRNNVNIVINVNESININAHPLRIQQILINLLSNAIDACSPYESDKILCSDKHVQIDGVQLGDEVRITISDNGCGMDNEHVSKLFTHPKTTKSSGTGIGLINTHSIITEELRGTIKVESKKGLGASVIVTLPRQGNKDLTHPHLK
ncbi:MAG TPA: HAMP domain-containing sensor histidine kinase [Candidatus Paceibacterota bacterium]|jgi:signal transduction histidine kinase|nr:HAMP domain-containing sensor histidine kinase [Candidatus Paceibacterota bacterium]